MKAIRWLGALAIGFLTAGWIWPLWKVADAYLFFWESPGMDLLYTGKSNYQGMGGGPSVIFMIAREDLRIALVWLGIVVVFWATIAAFTLFARRGRSSAN